MIESPSLAVLKRSPDLLLGYVVSDLRVILLVLGEGWDWMVLKVSSSLEGLGFSIVLMC